MEMIGIRHENVELPPRHCYPDSPLEFSFDHCSDQVDSFATDHMATSIITSCIPDIIECSEAYFLRHIGTFFTFDGCNSRHHFLKLMIDLKFQVSMELD